MTETHRAQDARGACRSGPVRAYSMRRLGTVRNRQPPGFWHGIVKVPGIFARLGSGRLHAEDAGRGVVGWPVWSWRR